MEKMLKSFQKNKKGIFLMVLSSICVCIGQLLWKMSTELGIWYMLIGFGFYGFGALIMIIAYRFGKVSILQPILSLNYVISIILAALVLKEKITLLKTVGVLVIIAGVLFIAGGDETTEGNTVLQNDAVESVKRGI